MADWEDALEDGIGGLEKIEGGLDGNMGGWAQGYTEQREAERLMDEEDYRSRPPIDRGAAVPRVIALIALALLVIAVLMFFS